MKYNKILVELANYKRLNFREFNNYKIEKISEPVEPFSFKEQVDLRLKDCKIIDIKQMACTWREVYRVNLDIKDGFVPGDSIGILCPNKDDYVEKILEILYLPDGFYRIERDGKNGFEFKGRLYEFFKYVFDFNSLPKKATLMKLAKGNKCLEFLSSREGSSDYFNMIKNWNNLLDIIYTFKCAPTLEDLIIGCETLKPRYYSLTNKVGEELEILVGIISKEVDLIDKNGVESKEVRFGHFSQYTKNPNGNIKLCYRPSTLIQQGNFGNILIICTGTGIAPFLSFLRNKRSDQKFWVIYGFRNKEDDLLLHTFENTIVSKVMSSCGVYVTDFLKINLDKIRDFSLFDCGVYVCGRMEMQREVYRIFKESITQVVEDKRLFFDNWQ